MTNEPYVVCLYGSRARGDHDAASDTDLLLVGDVPFEKAHLDNSHEPCHRSLYSWRDIERMTRYGSLFLHHVKAEGRPIQWSVGGRERLASCLKTLPAYSLADRDIDAFRQTIADVRESLEASGCLVFELSILGMVLRHAAILGCYLTGHPTFGREASFRVLAQSLGLPESWCPRALTLYAHRRTDRREIALRHSEWVASPAMACSFVLETVELIAQLRGM
jgi:hypothetical protein